MGCRPPRGGFRPPETWVPALRDMGCRPPRGRVPTVVSPSASRRLARGTCRLLSAGERLRPPKRFSSTTALARAGPRREVAREEADPGVDRFVSGRPVPAGEGEEALRGGAEEVEDLELPGPREQLVVPLNVPQGRRNH